MKIFYNLDEEVDYFYNQYLKNNARRNSFKQIIDIIKEKNYKELVELGTCREPREGASTILFSIISKYLNLNFSSIDISQENIDLSINHLKQYSVENYVNCVNYVNIDQYEYLNFRNTKIDFLYIDASDGAKNKVLDYVINKTDVLNDGALIVIDDMANELGAGETCLCIDIVNKSKNLLPIDKKQYFNYCEEEVYWDNHYSNYICNNNKLVYPNGVRQHPFQILLEYRKG